MRLDDSRGLAALGPDESGGTIRYHPTSADRQIRLATGRVPVPGRGPDGERASRAAVMGSAWVSASWLVLAWVSWLQSQSVLEYVQEWESWSACVWASALGLE